MDKNIKSKPEDLEYIQNLFDSDGIKAPDSLSEDRIMAMLDDADKAADGSATEFRKVSAAKDGQATAPGKRRPKFMRYVALAACALIAIAGIPQIYDVIVGPPSTELVDGELMTFSSYGEIDRLVASIEPKESFIEYGGDLLEGDLLEYDSDSMDTGATGNIANGPVEESAALDDGAAPDAISKSAQMDSVPTSGGADHSETYLQVEEVDEADIVKTDGKYIYYVTETQEVVILSAEDGKTEKLATIGNTGVENYIDDIYLKGDTLVTAGRVYDEDEDYAAIVTYDISDRKHPEVTGEFRQTGYIVSSRMVGDHVYLVTNDYVTSRGRTVPECTQNGKVSRLAVSDICSVPNPSETSYIVLSAVDITSGKQSRSTTKAVFGAVDNIYCNDHNLYAAVTEWSDDYREASTRIVRAGFDGINVKFNATNTVRGTVNNQFSMNEKDGYFYIATTGTRNEMDVNNLFVLDGSLKEAGKVTGFARNESIKSVRYIGDKAYVITYEAIDPLFVIDVSDPSKPVIEGEVKIDGFSTLLVPAGENTLLGIGYATGDNGYGGEYSAGLKLSLFDVSDPGKPVVIDSKEFKDMDSPVQSSHLALTVNSKEGWYAFPYGIYHFDQTEEPIDEPLVDGEEDPDALDGIGYVGSDSGYEAGVLKFTASGKIDNVDQHKLGSEYLYRSVYIGDYIYALNEDGETVSFKVE